MVLSTWSRGFFEKCILVCKLYIVLLTNLLHLNVNFTDSVKVDIPNKKLHTEKYFHEKSRDHIHVVIYRP